MASKKKVLAVLLSLAAVLIPFAMATDIIVGDENGWMPSFNYTEWAASKVFMVGDSLVFKYSVGDHNVIPIGGEEFKACNATGATKVFNSGRDVIPLKTTGKKWYLCGIAGHCQGGQKLVINVNSSGHESCPFSVFFSGTDFVVELSHEIHIPNGDCDNNSTDCDYERKMNSFINIDLVPIILSQCVSVEPVVLD